MSVESIKAKQLIVDEIKEKLEKAQSAVIIDYIGTTVEEANNMRKKLRAANVDYTVYKNTLIARAVEGTYFDATGIQSIADLPSRDELIAKFMGSIQSPVGKLVRTFQAIADAQGAPAAEAAAE